MPKNKRQKSKRNPKTTDSEEKPVTKRSRARLTVVNHVSTTTLHQPQATRFGIQEVVAENSEKKK